MAVTAHQVAGTHGARRVHRYTETSGDNAQLAATVNPSFGFRLLSVEVVYSSSVTKNVTVVRDSGAGAAFDITLNTIAISAATAGTYLPSVPPIFSDDDALVVTAPAGGSAGITSTISVYVERI